MPIPFDLNPTPHPGFGAFGLVPGPLGVPEPFGNIDPNLVGNVINSHIRGQLSPEELNAIQDENARFGIDSGMPGAGLNRNRGLRNLGLDTGRRQAQGLAEYNALVPGAGLLNEIATQNSLNAAAPDPAAAASYAEQLFNRYRNSIPGANKPSPSGGSGVFSPFNVGTNPAGGTVGQMPSQGGAGWGIAPNQFGDLFTAGNVPQDVASNQFPLAGEFALPGDTGGQTFGTQDWYGGDVFGNAYSPEFGYEY